jgi:hypothetical protein
MSKLRQFLTEERLNTQDKRSLLKLIDKPKKLTFVLKSFAKNYDESEREVDVYPGNRGLTFEYNSDFFELTNTLIDIADMGGHEFKSNTERNINTTAFTIIKGK